MVKASNVQGLWELVCVCLCALEGEGIRASFPQGGPVELHPNKD